MSDPKKLFEQDMAKQMAKDYQSSSFLQQEVEIAVASEEAGDTVASQELVLKKLFAEDVIKFARGATTGLLFPHTEALMVAELQVYGENEETWKASGLGFLSAAAGSVLSAGIGALGGYMQAKVAAKSAKAIAKIKAQMQIKLGEYAMIVRIREIDGLIEQAQIALETTKVGFQAKVKLSEIRMGGATTITAILAGTVLAGAGMYFVLGKK